MWISSRGSGHSVYADCGSGDNSCGVVVHYGDDIIVTVTLNYSDHTERYSAEATSDQYCGSQLC